MRVRVSHISLSEFVTTYVDKLFHEIVIFTILTYEITRWSNYLHTGYSFLLSFRNRRWEHLLRDLVMVSGKSDFHHCVLCLLDSGFPAQTQLSHLGHVDDLVWLVYKLSCKAVLIFLVFDSKIARWLLLERASSQRIGTMRSDHLFKIVYLTLSTRMSIADFLMIKCL